MDMMARQRLSNDKQWAKLIRSDFDEQAIMRHDTLSRDDIDLIAGKRGGHNRQMVGMATRMEFAPDA